jgi:hypothetical protein
MSLVESHPVTPAALTHIVRNLRLRDRQEIFALRWDDDEDKFAFEVCAIAGDLWKLWTFDGEPVAVNGVVPIRPGVVIAGAFGTSKWPRIVRPMTRWSMEFVIPCLKNSGYHRGEAYALVDNTDSRRWIELLGGEIEALLKGYGRHRENFLLYAWDLTQEGGSHVLRRRRQRQHGTAAPAVRVERRPG